MELFAAAGIELPIGGGSARSRRPAIRSLRIPLFSDKVVKLRRGLSGFTPSAEQRRVAADYARKAKSAKFLNQKETAVRPLFIQDILQTVLGYAGFDPNRSYSLRHEEGIRAGAVDVALGLFNRAEADDRIVAPFELKGPGFADLDRIMPGRGRSPVQQAWDYAIDAPGSRWVLVSNCVEIRLYGFGRGRDAYEVFDLRRLDEEEELVRLWLILSARSLMEGETDRLLRDTDGAFKEVTVELYRQYKTLRERLIDFLTHAAEGPKLASLHAIEPAQKLLDRVLFIAFAQRTSLLPDRLLEDAAKLQNKFVPQPIWANFTALFRAVDQGSNRLGIGAYNGGLFAADEITDGLVLPDLLAQDVAKLGEWDYGREVPVTVLGHLFEQSITDIEKLKAESKGERPDPVSKRKREGVVYTPDVVTRFLVERTVGVSLNQRRAALEVEHGFKDQASASDPGTLEREVGFWRAYLDALRAITIVDPACGSGAFLVAAFDELARRYRDAVSRLQELGVEATFDIFDEILTRNLHGVDLNPESVEITRLSLWLKTARREHRLQNLEATIKCGNSLIDDAAYTDRPFDWRTSFPRIFARGGFDVVIGNPPYVRMEYLKSIKPYLERYIVAADRADLYAYFFEKGVTLLRSGGRLGFISSSTFFRTGSGENLRVFLTDGVEVESVVDFGDIQLFEGVTTYPAILTLAKGHADPAGLSFLNVRHKLPDDLGRAFALGKGVMPRSRLGRGSWRFEEDALARLRDKIAVGRKTLGEVYGTPLRGIVTGLNEAFVIDRPTRDRLVTADPRSDDLLKPVLLGENIKRWRIETDDLFLVNTPKGKVEIEHYPAVRDWLLPFRPQLEERATKQAWWELQQAQLAYQSKLMGGKIVWPHFQDQISFAYDREGYFLNNKCFFLACDDTALLSVLHSVCIRVQLLGVARSKRGGYIEAEAQYVEQIVVPEINPSLRIRLADLGQASGRNAEERFAIQSAVRHRFLDLAPPDRRTFTGKLEQWHTLDFASFLTEVKKVFHRDIPPRQRRDWENYLSENSANVRSLSSDIDVAEREIDAIVYDLFAFTAEEITLVETSLAGRS